MVPALCKVDLVLLEREQDKYTMDSGRQIYLNNNKKYYGIFFFKIKFGKKFWKTFFFGKKFVKSFGKKNLKTFFSTSSNCT